MKCNIICDLMNLFNRDNISKESKEAIEEHIKNCDQCKSTYDNLFVIKDNKEDDFKIIANKIIKNKRKRNVTIGITVLIISVLVLNYMSAVITGRPLIILGGRSVSGSNGDVTYNSEISLGFRVDSYKVPYSANYSKVKPWFSSTDNRVNFLKSEYVMLMEAIVNNEEDKDISMYNNYLDTLNVANAKIYDIVTGEEENTYDIYLTIFKEGYVKYDNAAYSVCGSVIPTHLLVKKSDKGFEILKEDIPMDGSLYASSIKEIMPSYISNKVLEDETNERNDALRKQNIDVIMETWKVPVSENLLSLNGNMVTITEVEDGIDSNGQYYFNSNVIKEEILPLKE